MRVLAIGPLLLAGVLAVAGQAAATVAQTCLNGVGSQPPRPGNVNIFLGVTAPSACDIWAVGEQLVTKPNVSTLIEHWTGGNAWTVYSSPSPGVRSALTAVRAVSPTDIWAVGSYENSSGVVQSLIEHWDGTAWTQRQSSNPGSVSNRLFGVTATSATNAWAVGSYSNSSSGPASTLIEHWDGAVWTQWQSPSPGLIDNLSAVSATSATNAWAVGTTGSSPDHSDDQTLIERWDGSAWTRVPSPSPAGSSNLAAVAATSVGNAWAMGSSVDGSGDSHALIERWNGTAWTQSQVPDAARLYSLKGVAATSVTNAWAVARPPSSDSPALVLHWDGSAWTALNSPAPPGASTTAVVAAPGGGYVWAVGGWNPPPSGALSPLAMRLQDVPVNPVVVQGSDRHVYLTGPVEGLASTGVNLEQGTIPAAARSRGLVEAAWQASGTHHLFTLDTTGHQADTGLTVAAGTSPAVAALPDGTSFEIAFVNAADNQVWVLGPGGAPARPAAPGVTVAAGTSPAIAANANSGVKIAVHGAGSDHLWLIGPAAGSAREIGVALAAGTSPAIAASRAGFTTAFVNAADGMLWRVRRDGSVNRAAQASGGVAVAAGTSPSIAAAIHRPGVTFEMAVRGANGHLWLVGDDDSSAHDTGVPVLAGTSPSITAFADGFETSIQAPAHDLVTVPDTGPALNTSVIMATGTSPVAPVTYPSTSVAPNVMGVDLSIARDWITDAGLTVGTITPDKTCQDVKDAVLTQSPLHDDSAVLTAGTPVDLRVSTGTDTHGNPCIFK